MKIIFQLQNIAVWNGMKFHYEIRSFIKEYIENGNVVIDESLLVTKPKNMKNTNYNFDNLMLPRNKSSTF